MSHYDTKKTYFPDCSIPDCSDCEFCGDCEYWLDYYGEPHFFDEL